MTPAEQLTDWVMHRHQGQLIRKTNDPYFYHLFAVAEMAGPLTRLGYEIGLCHDLLEDTPTTAKDLLQALINFGYTGEEAGYITGCVVELTEVFTLALYPALSKKERREKEAARLAAISPGAQTVKYADLLYNIGWVLQYTPKKAKKYLKRKERLVSRMINGDAGLRHQTLETIRQALATFAGK